MSNGKVNIRGKEYKTVALRVAEFRDLCSIADGWGIKTEIISIVDDVIIMQAQITFEGEIVAVGHAEERRSNRGINSTSALENCETSAIGRALAAAGFGGSEYASANEVQAAIAQQTITSANAADKNNQQRQQQTPKFDPKRFAARLNDLGYRYDKVATHTELQGWGRPSKWTQNARDKFIADLKSGKVTCPK